MIPDDNWRKIAITLIDPIVGNVYETPLWGSAIYPKGGEYYDNQSDPEPNPFRSAFGY